MLYRSSLLVIVSILSVAAVAEQPGCTSTDIPVNVIMANGSTVEGLTTADFTAQAKGAVQIESLSRQSAPRRILFIMDTSKKLSPDARRLEVEFANGILDSAQAEDSFGLLTARGITQTVKFGSGREALKAALNTLNNSAAENGDNHSSNLDAIAEGIGWFEQPQFGDSIIVMAADLEESRKTSVKTVARLLGEHHIRLFGVALGPLQLNNSVAGGMGLDQHGFGYRQPGIPDVKLGDANFLPLSVNSGGYVAPENTERVRDEFKLSDAKKQQVHKTGELMASLIDNIYAMKIKAPSRSESWTLALTPGKSQSMPGAHVLYPHDVPACASAVASR